MPKRLKIETLWRARVHIEPKTPSERGTPVHGPAWKTLALASSGLDYLRIRGNSCLPECELLCGEHVVLYVKDDFGLPEPVSDLPVLGDRRGAEARLP